MIKSPEMRTAVDVSELIFQQDLAEVFSAKFGLEQQKAEDLGATTCSGVCYWEALNALGLKVGSIEDFVMEAYSPDKGILHDAGVDHIAFLKYLGTSYPSFYGLSINPYREQDPVKFREYGGYTGQRSEELFDETFSDITDTSSCAKAFLDRGGLALVSVNPSFNGYNGMVLVNGELKSGTTHIVLALDYDPSDHSFTIFDPDKRSFEDLGGKRPPEVEPIPEHPGLYKVSASYLDQKSYRENPSPGGVTIGLFNSKPTSPDLT